ncbi:tyrosine-type recombinase/integrase [Halobellus sp. H-GB7]|uniref:tyrosine-type recombinase/integrase n=1 Tax=Halobellus sp. H-GB7 TaxID=3069756 RepID=UPI0027AEC72E|nr:tyrosine-type recombinase/integrase [Halobellus sp. H-GB7]MDQ2053191.1 tyrosine-type recombinase/integrase [Halobellus sp. H-GB7]
MVGTEDVQGYARKFRNQYERVQDADIDERDREAILNFIHALDATGNLNEGTMGARINHLRLSSERADVPLVEMDKSDVDTLLFELNHEHGLAEGTRRNYRKSLRKFFRHRDEPWAEDITIGAQPSRSVDPDELLTDEEIDDLLDAAPNPRDKATIALLADTGLRIGAIASLRIRDLDTSGQMTTLSINEDANVKGASGTVPLTWSESHLTSYLNNHPRRDVDEAALIHKSAGWYDLDEDGEDGAMTYQYLSRRIKTAADKAGVARERVNTHNFRKTAISRWIREGLSEQAIKHRAMWDVDTDQIKTYSGVRDEELNDQILAHYGIDIERDEHEPTVFPCPRCRSSVREGQRFCPNCSAPLTDTAADAVSEATDTTTDELVSTIDPETRDELVALLENIEAHPEAALDV